MPSPIKPTLKSEIVPFALIVTSIIASFYFYAHFPAQVPTHWNTAGEINGWSSKTFGAFFLPILTTGLYLLLLTIPYINPKRERYEQFSKAYHIFKALIIFVMTAIYFVTSLSGLGHEINVSLWIPAIIGLLFIAMGKYMGEIKMNWFIGIRTPWTLSSETVWNKTHRLGGKLFILSGLAFLAMGFIPSWLRLALIIAVVILLALGTTAYSYWLYRQENKNKYDGKNNQ